MLNLFIYMCNRRCSWSRDWRHWLSNNSYRFCCGNVFKAT